jgi:hypothetical protein
MRMSHYFSTYMFGLSLQAQIRQGCSIFRTPAIVTVKVSFMVNVVDLSDFSPCVFSINTDVSLFIYTLFCIHFAVWVKFAAA